MKISRLIAGMGFALSTAVVCFRQLYCQTILVSHTDGVARFIEPQTQNRKGILHSPSGASWAAVQGMGFGAMYNGADAQQSRATMIPQADLDSCGRRHMQWPWRLRESSPGAGCGKSARPVR
jgi:hypothetical protein